MNVQCNVECLPKDLIYQAKANSVKAISSWDAAKQQITKRDFNVHCVYLNSFNQDNAKCQVYYHCKILIYLYLWGAYFLYGSNFNTDVSKWPFNVLLSGAPV